MAPHDLGDAAQRHALFRHRVQRRSRRGLLQCQAEEARGVEPVDGGPATGSVADVTRDALVPRDADQHGHEAVVAVAVNGRRKPHDRRADAAGRQCDRELGMAHRVRGPALKAGGAGRRLPVLLGRHASGASPRAPEAMRNGRSDPASASPKVSMARRSASAAPWKSPENERSCL